MKKYYSVIAKTTILPETEENESNLGVVEPEVGPNLDSIMQSTDTHQHESPSLYEVRK
ncbi:hypothetical protein LINGRAHAP2_LOCUS11417, partial [Linum grandiflorum]